MKRTAPWYSGAQKRPAQTIKTQGAFGPLGLLLRRPGPPSVQDHPPRLLPVGGGVEGGHGLHQIAGVPHPGGLKAGVHGQLGQADVHRVHRHMGVGDVPQGGAPRQVGAVGEVLHRHPGAPAQGGEHPRQKQLTGQRTRAFQRQKEKPSCLPRCAALPLLKWLSRKYVEQFLCLFPYLIYLKQKDRPRSL